MSQLLTNAKQQFLDSFGNPLAGGSVAVYQPGTVTPVDTWKDQALTVLNTKPVTLDSSGRAIIWVADGANYRQIVWDSYGNQIWDQVCGNTVLAGSGGASIIDGPVTSQVSFNATPQAIAALGGGLSNFYFNPTPTASATSHYGVSIGMNAGAGASGNKVACEVNAYSGASGSSMWGMNATGSWNAGDPTPGGGINAVGAGINNYNSDGPVADTLTAVSIVSGGTHRGGEGVFIDAVSPASAWHWGMYITQGSIQAGGTGLAIGYPTAGFSTPLNPASINADFQMLQNAAGAVGLKIRRLTDTAPVGAAIQVTNQANTSSVFSVSVSGDVNANSLNLTGATTSSSATAGSVALPSTPVGFLSLIINGTLRKIPYYAA